MHTHITFIFLGVVVITCLIAALLFIVRLLCIPFESGKIVGQMQKHPIIHGVWAFFAFIGVLVFIFAMNPQVFTGGTRGRYMRQQKYYAEAFKTGDTNVPLFAMDWFAPWVQFCRVDQSGKGAARRDVGHAIQAGCSISLDKTNLQALVDTINHLPPPPKYSLPIERQIVVGCIRSNQWFCAVYDRADIPKELEKVAEITGAYLPWYIPAIPGHLMASNNDWTRRFYCVATEAPVAVSDEGNFLQIWDLRNFFHIKSSRLEIPRQLLFSGERTAAISPNGNFIALATYSGICVFDRKKEKVLWKMEAKFENTHSYSARYLCIGDNGQTLFMSDGNMIEQLDLLTGKNHSVLITNKADWDGVVRFLKISANGKILIAGFGANPNATMQGPRQFVVWEMGKDKPAFKFEEKENVSVDLSPDGEWIAMGRFGIDKLKLFKWRTDEKKEVRLRNLQGIDVALWSPDGKRLAGYNYFQHSVIFYDTTSWKPIAQWGCGTDGSASEFSFGTNGVLYHILKVVNGRSEINALDVSRL